MKPMPELEMSPSRQAEVALIENHIRLHSTADGVVRIREAGCGRRWVLSLSEVKCQLTGVDSDPHALAIRKDVLNDLDEVVEGDLRTVNFPVAHFDVIYNSFVLDHIAGAEPFLLSFLRWLKPGGLVILRIPDPALVQGFVTRATPHWFHVCHYKGILRLPNAGKPGFPPYPTYYDSVVSRSGIYAFCREHGQTIEAERGDGFYRPGYGWAQRLIEVVKGVIALLSFGSLSCRHTNLLYILRTKVV